MKEATGELNSTVIIVIAVAMLAAFFYMTIWPIIRGNTDQNTKCAKAYCEKCDHKPCDTVQCHYKDKDGNEQPITCVWKG